MSDEIYNDNDENNMDTVEHDSNVFPEPAEMSEEMGFYDDSIVNNPASTPTDPHPVADIAEPPQPMEPPQPDVPQPGIDPTDPTMPEPADPPLPLDPTDPPRPMTPPQPPVPPVTDPSSAIDSIPDVQENVVWSFDFGKVNDSLRDLVDNLAGDEQVQHDTFSAHGDDVSQMHIEIDFSIGRGSIQSTTQQALFEAAIDYLGEMEYMEQGTDVKRIMLRQKPRAQNIVRSARQGLRAIADQQELLWDVRINRDVPAVLKVSGGAAPVRIDLTGQNLKRVEFDQGVGTVEMVLPGTQLDVEIDGGVGQTTLHLMEGASGQVEIDAGVGNVTVYVSPGVAVEVKSERGVGLVTMPQNWRSISKAGTLDSKQTWRTEGYDLADSRLTIRYDGGVGNLNVVETSRV